MTAVAYYNEIEPFAAETLKNLITAGHIAPGIVDTRSIEDVTPNDITGFTQCHFFAGIGVWSYAARLAGWRDADWLYCRDDKWRAVEPGTFPLAYGFARSLVKSDAGLQGMAGLAGFGEISLRAAKRFRKGSLQAYGNAVDAHATADFVRAVMECI